MTKNPAVNFRVVKKYRQAENTSFLLYYGLENNFLDNIAKPEHVDSMAGHKIKSRIVHSNYTISPNEIILPPCHDHISFSRIRKRI
jgi:hypothetical protein